MLKNAESGSNLAASCVAASTGTSNPASTASDFPLKQSLTLERINAKDLSQEDFQFLFKKWGVNTLSNEHIIEAIQQGLKLIGKDPSSVLVIENNENLLKVSSPSNNRIWSIRCGYISSYEEVRTVYKPLLGAKNDQASDRENWGNVDYNQILEREKKGNQFRFSENRGENMPRSRERNIVYAEMREHDHSIDLSFGALLRS